MQIQIIKTKSYQCKQATNLSNAYMNVIMTRTSTSDTLVRTSQGTMQTDGLLIITDNMLVITEVVCM